MLRRSSFVPWFAVAVVAAASGVVRADVKKPAVVESEAALEIPKVLSLSRALELFHQRGYDLLIADANVKSAEGDEAVAGASPNPTLGFGYGRVLGKYDAALDGCDGCSKNAWSVGIGDNAALFDSLSGKRGLRLKVAQAAIAALKLAKSDAVRTLDAQVKTAFFQLAAARRQRDFSVEVQTAAEKTLEVSRARFPGKIDEGALARIETAKLEADRGVDLAVRNLKTARVGLAYLLGVRGVVPTFDVEGDPLKFVVPTKLASATEASLTSLAMDKRPDLRAAEAWKDRAEASIDLAKRLRFPDVGLSVSYSMTGNGQSALNPPTLTFGLTFTLPALYQYQGEIKKASADLEIQTLSAKKIQATITADVATAYASFALTRKIVERMEGSLLDRAKKARDIVEAQFNEGKAPLVDFLDAQRTFIAANVEYVGDLLDYWTAIVSLEQAVGTDLRG